MKLRYIITLLISIGFLSIGGFQVSANDLEIPFSVNLTTPDSQDEGVDNYVSITTDEDKIEEAIEYTLINNTSEDKEVSVEVVDAYTAPSGTVQYSVKGPEGSEITNEEYKISNYIMVEGKESENIISLKPDEVKVITLDLSVDKMDGTLLGGVLFKEHVEETEANEETFAIQSEINMIIGIKVDFGTDLLVDLTAGKPFIENMPSAQVVRLPIEINTPAAKKVNFNYSVSKDGIELFENKKEIDFAPFTKVDARLPWEYLAAEEGVEYSLKGDMTYVDLDGETRLFHIDKVFEVKAESTLEQVFSRIAAPIEERGFSPYWLLGLLIIPTGILTLIFLFIMSRKYHLYSNDETAIKVVEKDTELYDEIDRDKSNSEGYKYLHIYLKRKGAYKHVDTVEILHEK